MHTRINRAHGAATRNTRGLRFFSYMTRRPLFAFFSILAAAIGLTVLLLPVRINDYESLREENVQLTGTISAIEQKPEGDMPVWRMILTDVDIEKMNLSAGAGTGKKAGMSEASDKDGTGEKAVMNEFSDRGEIGEITLDKDKKVLCVLDHAPEGEMSARVRVRGKLFPFRSAMNEGEFDLRMYYHILRIEFSLRDAEIMAVSAPTDRIAAILFNFKKNLSSIIDRVFSKQNAPILKAMLLGEKGLLEEETKELYQGAGIVHILSISGLHLSLIGMGLFSLTGKCRFIPLPLRAALSVIAVFLYGKMIGLGTSVFRALIMLTLYIISKVIGRTYDLLTAASIAAFLLLLDQPLYLLHTGFQFSFGAVLAIGILLPALPGRALKTLAIPAATLPVYLWAYGTFPVTSLLLNLIVIPLMTVVMVSAGGAVLLAGLPDFFSGGGGMPDTLSANRALPSALKWLPRILGLPAELILDFYRFLAESSEKIPGHEIVLGRPSPIRILFFYIMLLILAAISVRLQMPHMRRRIEAEAVSMHTEDDGRKKLDRVIEDDSRKKFDRVIEDDVRKKLDRVIKDDCRKNLSGLTDNSDRKKYSSLDENRADMLLRRAASKICQMLHLRDNHSRKNFACICTVLWMAAAFFVLVYHPWPALEVDMIYVGQGDGIFISSRGRHFLIDGGSSTKEELAKYTLLPYLHNKGVGRLDGIFLTHDDTDHCSCLLEFLEAAAEDKPLILINAVYLPDIAEAAKGENYRRIELLSGQVGIPVCYISRGQRIRSGNLTLDCLHPARGASYEDANEYSTTLLLRYGDSSKLISDNSDIASRLSGKEKGFSVLFTGDLEGQGEEDFLHYLAETKLLKTQDGLLNIDVLKVAHHGSKNATSSEFLQAVHPDMVMISAGINNMYKHPSEELLNRLAISIPDSSVYRTDLQGEITICHKKGGDDYRVKTFSGGTTEVFSASKRRSLGSEATEVPKK